MRTRARWAVPLLVIVAVALLLSATGPAWANYYAGNYRIPGYGVKADISTPFSVPTLNYGVIFNWVGNDDSGDWIQCGWVRGDGYSRAPDTQLWPTSPSSYEESQVGTSYSLNLYSPQPLGYARTYEVVHIGSGVWQGIIATQRRVAVGPFTTPVQVEALAEIFGSSQNHTWAYFNNVQYKGLSSYMAFNQNYERADCPPYATFTSYSKYTCYNGM